MFPLFVLDFLMQQICQRIVNMQLAIGNEQRKRQKNLPPFIVSGGRFSTQQTHYK
jgi:hypothetical protein